MTDPVGQFEQARSWALDTQQLAARSRRAAWIVAAIAVAVALFEAVALAMLTPLKTVQPITLLVDRQTGYVQALDPYTPKRVSADEALTNAFLAQYVGAREEFDRATVSLDYRRVALWSAGNARRSYLAIMPATNPDSPFQRYPARAIVQARVKSVSRLAQGLALVRFDTQVQDGTGQGDPPHPWIATIRFRYVDAPMRMEDRLVNPLGFQVVGYRRDAEAPSPMPSAPVGAIYQSPGPQISRIAPAAARLVRAPQLHAPVVAEALPPAVAVRRSPRRIRRLVADSGQATVPSSPDQLPLGSPLSPTNAPIEQATIGPRAR